MGKMKRIRRLSIEIEQRRLTLTLTATGTPTTGATATGTPGPRVEPIAGHGSSAIEAYSHLPVCPDCGSSWIVVAGYEADTGVSTAVVLGALRQLGLHLEVSPSGTLRICSKSFEEARRYEIKESL